MNIHYNTCTGFDVSTNYAVFSLPNWFITPNVNFTVDTRPYVRDLYRYITPQYSKKWKEIGKQLGLPTSKLDIIEYDHNKDIHCCNAMLGTWLSMDTTSSWRKLFTVIESPTASYSVPDKLKGNQLYPSMYV